MKRIVFILNRISHVYLLLLLVQPICFGNEEKIYHGIGQVTVLYGEAISFPFEAKISKCHVRPGQYVKKNQSLFSFDVGVLEKEIQKLEIEYLELKQNLYELEKSNINLSEGALNLRQALQEAEYAQKRKQDSERLWQAGIISHEEYLWDKRRHRQSVDNYKKQLALHQHLTNRNIQNEKRLLLNKKIKSNQTLLKKIKTYASHPVFNAWQEGLVLPVKLKPTEFYCQAGENLLNEQVVFWLTPLEDRRVELKMDQIELSQVKVGNKAEIYYQGDFSKKYLSEVMEIDAMPESTNMPPKYRVFLKVQNAEQVKLGTQAKVKVYFE
jgi:multidrug resistance efflux pump